jgi:succinate dehydrogenase (ubiquinone) cytochrome b560 subunit
MPDWVKYVEKTIVAAPFAFHSLNGVRHLIWDLTKGAPYFTSVWRHLLYLSRSVGLSNRAVIRGGWAVVGGTVISTIALVLL